MAGSALTAAGCASRRSRLWLWPEPWDIDWVLLRAPEHLTYFAGFYPSPFEYRSQNAGAALLIDPAGSCTLIADNMLRPYAERAFVDERVQPTWYDGKHTAPHRGKLLNDAIINAADSRRGRCIGIDSQTPSVIIEALRVTHSDLKAIDVSAAIHEHRRCKDPDELRVMRLSIAAGEAGFAAAAAELKPGMTELQVFELVQQAAMEAAGFQVVVYGDFASGPRTGGGGGGPTQRLIEAGDLIILDFSVIVQGYRGDFANTLVAGGKPTERQSEMASMCKQAMEAGERELRAGVSCRAVDAAVRSTFAAKGLADRFHHHSGHGLGLGHPDPPYIVPESIDTLRSGDVVTLEPGVYFPGEWGMRFERNYFITEDGYETLTHHHIGLVPQP